ncbi:hypothetical protein RI054_09g45870 [Pseudoscourfieldia marina]
MVRALEQLCTRWRAPMVYAIENVAFQFAMAHSHARQVTGLSTGALGRRCSWLLISRTAGGWRRFIKDEAPSTVAWIPLPVSSPD